MAHIGTALLLAVLAMAAGCRSSFGPEVRDEPALIVFYGDTAGIEAPDAVPGGTLFPVSLRTFGGGCTR